MKLRTLPPLLLLAVLLAGCGSSGAVKLAADDVAAVGSQHVTLVQYDQALTEERASLKAAHTAIPKAGTTAYQSLQTTIINALVQQAEFALEAVKLGVTVTPADTEKQLAALKKQYFHSSDKAYRVALKQQGFTDAEVRTNIAERLLQQKLFAVVTKNTKPTKAQVDVYYLENITQYQKAATRKVREILAGKNKQSLAEQIYRQLKGGASFAALAKRYSQDPGSKNTGGLFTATDGSDVPEFDKAVFAPAAKTGQLLAPVKTAQYGWFVIQPLAPIVRRPRRPPRPSPRRRSASRSPRPRSSRCSAPGCRESRRATATAARSATRPAVHAVMPDPCATLSTTNATTT